VIAPGSRLPVRASFPESVRPFLEDGKNEVWYRGARYRCDWYRFRRLEMTEDGILGNWRIRVYLKGVQLWSITACY
jgi:hypothetical protein